MAEDYVPTVWSIAGIGECASPDATDTPGAEWLELVYRDALELVGWLDDEQYPDDAIHERADAIVPIFTHRRWQIFVDLAAYREDVSELLPDAGDDLTGAAGVALYMIAERIYRHVVDEHDEGSGDDA